jgi:uncharacterized protein
MLAQLLTAGALVLVIEGAGYAFAPGLMQKLARSLLDMTEDQLRIAGLVAVGIGVAGVWLIRILVL